MDEKQNTSAKGFEIRDMDEERRERLAKLSQNQVSYNPAYSAFIRRAKLFLPLIALIILGVVFAWGHMSDESIVPVQDETKIPKTIGKNELINAKFESTDEKKQPYSITAERAVQSRANEDLVLLEKPLGDMLLNSGNWIAIDALQGSFRQDTQQLLLEGDVNLFHDKGYQLQTQILNIDLSSNHAWTEKDVSGHGPAGTIEAKGMEAFSSAEHLIFTGPAKLVLDRSVSKNEAGDL